MTVLGTLAVLHVVGAAIGVGAAAASDSVFLSAIRNRRVGHDQFVLIRATSHVVMGGLTLLVFSGLVLLLYDLERWEMAHFQAKMIAVLVLMLNGFVFHLVIIPFLGRHQHALLPEEIVASKLWLFAATGAVSAVSWFYALVLALIGPVPMNLLYLLIIYLLLIIGGAGAGYLLLSHLLERWDPAAEPVYSDEGAKGEKWNALLLAILVLLLITGFAVGLLRL